MTRIPALYRWWRCRFVSMWKAPRYRAGSIRRSGDRMAFMKMALRSSAFALAMVVQAAAPKPFKIVEAGIHQTEDGPLAPPGSIFVPGEVIFFSCRLDGYAVSPEKKVAIRYEFSAVDPGGVPIVEPASGKIDAELSPQDKEWKPKIRQTALVP